MRERLSDLYMNEKGHESVRAAIEISQACQSNLDGRLANAQQGFALTTDQAREFIEHFITESRTALIEVRGEGLLEALRALHTTLTDNFRYHLLSWDPDRAGCHMGAPPIHRKCRGHGDESASLRR